MRYTLVVVWDSFVCAAPCAGRGGASYFTYACQVRCAMWRAMSMCQCVVSVTVNQVQ